MPLPDDDDGVGVEVLLELWQTEEDLHDRVHVARIAKVFHSSEAWSEDWIKLLAFFQDLGQSQIQIGLEVQFSHSFLGLHLRSDVDSKYC